MIDDDLRNRILFVIHRALVDARQLAAAKRCDQLYELMDAIEPIPSWLSRWEDANLADIDYVLDNYASKFPSSFRYVDVLRGEGVPRF